MSDDQTDTPQIDILVVDDTRANLQLLIDILTKQGYKVRPASNGRMALLAAQTKPPDLILLDIMMPDMNGYEVCEQLKADERTSHIPVIFISAMSETVDKVKAFSMGGVDYITKPFHGGEVLARVNTHVTIHNLQMKFQEQNERLQEENTRRWRVQDALRESRERYRLLAEHSTDMISTQTPQGIYRYVSPACCALLGYEIEEMVGHAALEFFHSEDLKTIPELDKPVEEWPSVFTITYRARRKDNSYVWLETTNRVVRDPEMDMIAEIIAVSRDITERKQAEEALQKAHDELEQRVKERTAELAKTNLALGRFVPYEFLYFLGRESIVDVNLGDQVQQEMTVLFSDIRDFTSLSEEMSPQENFNFLNVYLSRVSPIIRQHNGFVDKYIGDAVMALFPEKPEDALQAAIAMRQEVSSYNKDRQKHEHRPIKIGIGIHTGKLMLGIVGEAERMDSTVISDAVNLASRIEGLTKLYGASIIISQDSLYSLDHPARYHSRFLDRVQVKGKNEPVSVFEIFSGDPEEMVELKLETLTEFEKGLLHYHSQEFAETRSHFEQVLNHNPDDKAARLYLKRTTYFLEHGVPPDWEGVEALTEK